MHNRDQIGAEYDKRELAAGGLAHADPKAIAQSIADDFQMDYAEVREHLIEHFIQGRA